MSFYLTQSLHRALRAHPDRLAAICGPRRTSYRAFGLRVAKLASALQGLGLRPGDRVGMLALNSDRFLEYFMAVFWAGGIANPVNIRWSAREILQALADSETSIMLVDDAFLTIAQNLAAEAPSVEAWIYAGDGPTPAGMADYEALIAAADPIADAHRCGDDPAFLLYTGGTTGAPKGVLLSHRNMAAAVLGMRASEAATGAIYLHAAPMFHMGDIQMMFSHFAGGGTHVALPGFDPAKAMELIAREAVTDVLLAPTMLQMMISHPAMAAYDLSTLTQVFYGTAPITLALLEAAMAALPQARFIQGFGMTEIAISSILSAEYHTEAGRLKGKLGSAGKPCLHTEIKIAGPDQAELPPGIAGEILVRGPSVMLGYWRRPAETEAVLRDGWMHTGDAGYLDEDGFLFIVDRIKDMIISGGENIYSSEVENAICQHPDVALCAVIGVPDERWGERVRAEVVPRPGASLTADALMAHCRSLIAGYKCPREIAFRASLPCSAAGKVLKAQLRKEARADLAALAS